MLGAEQRSWKEREAAGERMEFGLALTVEWYHPWVRAGETFSDLSREGA